MDAIRVSSGWVNSTVECDPMVKIELEAAEALAGLSHFPANMSESRSSESIAERVKDESNHGNSSFETFPKCSSNSYQDRTNPMLKKSENSGILNVKSIKDERSTELRLNPTFPTDCASTGRKSRQNLTEAELEARKIRRVLANRESARQTIRRRQAIFEELTRKAVDLAWENDNLKREKDSASKHYDSLKSKNECLKSQMNKIMNIEAEETTITEPAISASSTNSPFIIYNQPPFLPLVWPPMVQTSGQLPPAGIVFPINKPDSSEEGSSTGSPLYLLPYPWLVTLPQNTATQPRLHSFNLNDKPKESSECREFFPEKVDRDHHCFPPDGGGDETTETGTPRVSREALIEHDDNSVSIKEVKPPPPTIGDGEICSGKRLGDVAAAAEARKRRKQLTRLKNNFHCRQLRMY